MEAKEINQDGLQGIDFNIPAKPEILLELELEQCKKYPSMSGIAEVIVKDVALAGSVIKIVNSAAYGQKRHISNIKTAVNMLGIDSILRLVSFFQLRKVLTAKASISLEKFWDTSMQTANMMAITHSYFNKTEHCSREDAYSFGLFRDCGIPLMAIKYDNYKTVLMEANSSPQRKFTDIEESYFPTNHAIVGYFIANTWQLPKFLPELILRHHEQNFTHDKDVTYAQKALYALSKIASNALSKHKYNHDDCEWLLGKEAALGFFQMSDLDYQELEADLIDAYRVLYG
ncbi:HDOD domain-containing protein [Methylophaga sp.]|uniref:HDOD domain-containing protein n=1 Tax=Methylophaga sp. TaxID=2024840 RepID=UPI00260070D3|nr:HDOD domain-containing protein [Methylophaga sp.]